ncbi:OB-fold nucleic acid binding domain-containing protein [Methanolobus sp.]|jgi:hypothetical protein|uniref:OB-fold nucleic acid binding domain-containing protein n=1 Tax=Methanolobus sp. TaxID=1874737 RepID=UPI0025DE9997|nr:OB-fold nucleic acid binding domain-containing protein [Methanolobus sp.]
MEKEEKIVVILLCMVLLSLAIAYATFCSDETTGISEGFSSSSLPGENVRFEGDVLSKRMTYTGDHLLMDVDYGSGVVKVFVPSGNGAKDVDSKISANDHVLVIGTVDEFEGELEVVIQSSDGITLLQ